VVLLVLYPGGVEGFSCAVEPAEPDRLAVLDGPHVALLALDRDAGLAAHAGERCNDDDVVAGLDEALGANLDVVVGVADEAEAPGPAPSARLDRVRRVDVLDLGIDEAAGRGAGEPGGIDAEYRASETQAKSVIGKATVLHW
jgi:hypothetical protein